VPGEKNLYPSIFKTKDEYDAYELGYSNGESSGNVDWLIAIDMELEIPDEVEIQGPFSFFKVLREYYTLTKKEVL